MKLLLDTHIFLWLDTEPDRLGRHLDLVQDGENLLFVSAAVTWEIVLKRDIGKLPPELRPPDEWVPDRIREFGARPLSIDHHHVFLLANLPAIHRDPFDRIMIAQALALDLTILTADSVITRYPVSAVRVT